MVVVWMSVGLREWLLEGWLVIFLKLAPRVIVREAGKLRFNTFSLRKP